jgi:hypothetical protein
MAVDVTLSVPEDMMQLARKVAHDAQVAVEAVLLNWIQHPIQDVHELDLNALKMLIPKYNHIQLWTVVYRDLPSDKLHKMNELISASRSHILSTREQSELDSLLHQSNVSMMLCGKAVLELQKRGFDVSRLLIYNISSS